MDGQAMRPFNLPTAVLSVARIDQIVLRHPNRSTVPHRCAKDKDVLYSRRPLPLG
jgi:hypothetical protein